MTDPSDLTTKLDRLATALEGAKTSPFSEEDVATIRRMVLFFQRLEAAGWWGKHAAWMLAGLAGIIINWDRIRASLLGGP